MKLIIKPATTFGTIKAIGVHQLVEGERDVDNAFYNADRDNFPAVYLYVSDLALVKYARWMLNNN